MPHIKLNNDFPGILGLLYYKPKFGKAMAELTQVALRGPSPLAPAQRELIAAHVSNLNQCVFCREAHAAVASELLGDGGSAAACVVEMDSDSELSTKMQALLQLAARVQEGGRSVSPADVHLARQAGASDEEIHDTVFVAGVFAFANRYVDGLGAVIPTQERFYRESGKFLARFGYQKPGMIGRFFVGRMWSKLRGAASDS